MEDYYCPDCGNKLERISGCGTVGYMCDTCKHLVSKSKILTEQELVTLKENPDSEENKKN
ncbi:MAG: hypothetical protein K0Q48_2887 [Bacillota bacterium]|nr:hypothetical protein [Bacillota bacterium]